MIFKEGDVVIVNIDYTDCFLRIYTKNSMIVITDNYDEEFHLSDKSSFIESPNETFLFNINDIQPRGKRMKYPGKLIDNLSQELVEKTERVNYLEQRTVELESALREIKELLRQASEEKIDLVVGEK